MIKNIQYPKGITQKITVHLVQHISVYGWPLVHRGPYSEMSLMSLALNATYVLHALSGDNCHHGCPRMIFVQNICTCYMPMPLCSYNSGGGTILSWLEKLYFDSEKLAGNPTQRWFTLLKVNSRTQHMSILGLHMSATLCTYLLVLNFLEQPWPSTSSQTFVIGIKWRWCKVLRTTMKMNM